MPCYGNDTKIKVYEKSITFDNRLYNFRTKLRELVEAYAIRSGAPGILDKQGGNGLVAFHDEASPAINDTTRLPSRSRQILDPGSLNDDFDAWRINCFAGKSEATGRVA
jgi:hypothetical protein